MSPAPFGFLPGTVYLVGAGPGDPDLITVRGLRCLRAADVVFYDRLLDPALLDEASDGARRVFVGKAPGRPGLGQEAICRLLVEEARRGAVVVRLKGGDPFVFGRGGEEAAALNAAGVPWEVVPAVSSALGVPARAGIPLTHRRLARSFTVVTGHRTGDGDHDWAALAGADTLVVLMGVAVLPRVVRQLVAHGRDPVTPAAVIERGTLPDERVVVAPLGEIAERAAEAGVRPPAVVVVGEVVALREELCDVGFAEGGLSEAASGSRSRPLTPEAWPETPLSEGEREKRPSAAPHPNPLPEGEGVRRSSEPLSLWERGWGEGPRSPEETGAHP